VPAAISHREDSLQLGSPEIVLLQQAWPIVESFQEALGYAAAEAVALGARIVLTNADRGGRPGRARHPAAEGTDYGASTV